MDLKDMTAAGPAEIGNGHVFTGGDLCFRVVCHPVTERALPRGAARDQHPLKGFEALQSILPSTTVCALVHEVAGPQVALQEGILSNFIIQCW